MSADQESLRILNESGFPLQIAVQRLVRETHAKHGWRVRYAEHAWVNRADGSNGFVDVVLDNHGTTILLVECKRVRHSTWLFLPADGQAQRRRNTKAWVSLYQSGAMPYFGWVDIPVDPHCPETHFCAVRGQTSSERTPLLERTGAELVSATEALAAEERDYRPDNAASLKIYLNAIVTTADIQLARFDACAISLGDGTVAQAECESVPYVRLRKQLSTRAVAFSTKDFQRGVDVAKSKEHSVFVVRADALSEFLVDLEVDSAGLNRLGGG